MSSGAEGQVCRGSRGASMRNSRVVEYYNGFHDNRSVPVCCACKYRYSAGGLELVRSEAGASWAEIGEQMSCRSADPQLANRSSMDFLACDGHGSTLLSSPSNPTLEKQL